MEQKAKKSIPKIIILGAVFLVVAFYGWKKISYSISHESTDNAQVETILVPVLPRVSGYVKEITVRDFDSVRSGQLVAELDDAEMQSMLTQMEADYASAQADLANAK